MRRFKNRMVLNCGNNEVLALFLVCKSNALERGIIGFTSTRGKANLGRAGIDSASKIRARLLKLHLFLLSWAVERRGVEVVT